MSAKIVRGSIHETKTAAGQFATGYRNARKRFGQPAVKRGGVEVRPIGKTGYYGVYDLMPERDAYGSRYITLTEAVKLINQIKKQKRR